MDRYNLEALGDERFQSLCQALIIKDHPRTQCFPVNQPDGGRDSLVYEMREDDSGPIQAVFQVRCARAPDRLHEPHKWVAELVKIEDLRADILSKVEPVATVAAREQWWPNWPPED